MLSYERLRELIPQNVDIISLDSVSSTNDYAMKLAKQGKVSDTLIVADEQISGKGTRGRRYFSSKGKGIYMSLLVRAGKAFVLEHPLTPAAAVAVRRALRNSFSLDSEIKWVNDVLIGGKKVCGILVESAADPSGDGFSLIFGIGINLYSDDFPEEIREKAASVGDFAEVKDAEAFVADVTAQLLGVLRDSPPDVFMDEYRNSSATLGNEVSFVCNGEQMTGYAADINSKGNLVVKTAGGDVTLVSGDVSVYQCEVNY